MRAAAIFLLMSSSLATASMAADTARVETTAEGALEIAARLITNGAYDEAEAVLATLASGDPTLFDMRQVDRLASAVAFLRGNKPEAERILLSLLEYDPDDWRARQDLAHLYLAAERPRDAERHFRQLVLRDAPAEAQAAARAQMAAISDSRLVHTSFRAAAAPSTNVNSATSARSFDLFGFLPAPLDDDARAQSGLGVTWVASASVTPKLNDRVRGFATLTGQFTDYENAPFDQASASLETGFRFANPGPTGLRGVMALSHTERYFAGEEFSSTSGGRGSVTHILGPRASVSTQFSGAFVDYRGREDRDGPILSAGLRMTLVPTAWSQTSLSLGVTREQTNAETLRNWQTSLGGLIAVKAPAEIVLTVAPTYIWREFDEIAALFGVLREDETMDIAVSAQKIDWHVNGFSPAFTYRYTENDSTVTLFDYDRHTVDISFARSF